MSKSNWPMLFQFEFKNMQLDFGLIKKFYLTLHFFNPLDLPYSPKYSAPVCVLTFLTLPILPRHPSLNGQITHATLTHGRRRWFCTTWWKRPLPWLRLPNWRLARRHTPNQTEGGRWGLLRMYRDVHLLAQITWLIKKVMGLKFYINNLFNSYILG